MKFPVEILKEGWTGIKTNRRLQYLILLSILTIAFWDYLSSLFQPYFQNIGVPDPLFGFTMALASIFAFLASRNAYRIEKRLGPRISLLIATLFPGLIYMILFINNTPWMGIILVASFRGFNALKHPLLSDLLNRQISSQSRATVISMINMMIGVYTAIMGIVIGAVAERSLRGSFLLSGIIITLSAIFIALDKNDALKKV